MNVALHPINVLGICAGVGGLELGLQLAHAYRGQTVRGVCYVEREAAAAASLVASMEAGWLHPAPIWSDARTFDGRQFRGLVDIVTSGDPCQGNSVAGKRLGELDDRWLLDRAIDIFDQTGANTFFRENVPGNARKEAKRAFHESQGKIILINTDWLNGWGDRQQAILLGEKLHGKRSAK